MEPFPIFWVVVPLLLVVIAAGAYAYDRFRPKEVLNQVTELKLEDNEVIQEVEELPEALPKKQTLRGYAWSSAKSMGAWALGYGEEADPDKVDETPNTNKVMV